MDALSSTALESPCGKKALPLWAAGHRYSTQGVQVTHFGGEKIENRHQSGRKSLCLDLFQATLMDFFFMSLYFCGFLLFPLLLPVVEGWSCGTITQPKCAVIAQSLACKVPALPGWRASEFALDVMREWKLSEFLGAFPNPN